MTRKEILMRRLIGTVLAALALSLGTAAVASADPSFGPGNGSQVGDKCHPPGITEDVPGCK